jgi:metal-responsive CopG/Arc/MetJ family transcriptional regulator
MGGKTVTSVSLPSEVLKEAEKIAKEKHQSRSELIKEAVLEYLEQHRWHKLQEEALPYAAAAGVRTEEDVEKIIREIRKPGRGKKP